MNKEFKIANKTISENSPVFIIAELSANHNQRLEIAIDTIKAAKEAGADAIKLQTYTPDTITLNSSKEYFQIKQGTIWDGKTLYDLYQEAYTPWEWHGKLKEVTEEQELIFFSSPFDFSAVDFLEDLKVPAYKIASFEITDIPLIEYVASKGKPVIISTGIARLEDIHLAVDSCKNKGNNNVALLKCTSAYPAPLEDLNLKVIPDLKERFDVIIGLSDHTLDNIVAVAAISQGAKIIEKHIILDKSLGGPDAKFSLDPKQFSEMVKAVRNTEMALGKVSYDLSKKVEKSREHSRSLFVVDDIKKGEKFSKKNIKSIRPAFGLHPKFYYQILGKHAKSDIEKGTPLSWDLIDERD